MAWVWVPERIKCQVCGNEFETQQRVGKGGRIAHKLCSPTCRKEAHRRRMRAYYLKRAPVPA